MWRGSLLFLPLRARHDPDPPSRSFPRHPATTLFLAARAEDAKINWTKLEITAAPSAEEVAAASAATVDVQTTATTEAEDGELVSPVVETVASTGKEKGRGKVVGKAKEESRGKQSTLLAAWGKKA